MLQGLPRFARTALAIRHVSSVVVVLVASLIFAGISVAQGDADYASSPAAWDEWSGGGTPSRLAPPPNSMRFRGSDQATQPAQPSHDATYYPGVPTPRVAQRETTVSGPPIGAYQSGLEGFELGGNPRSAEPEYVQVDARVTPHGGGRQATLSVRATMLDDWHIYSITQPPGGPVKTTIELKPSPQYRLTGQFRPSEEPHSRREPLFDNIVVETHGGTVVWQAPIELAAGVDPNSVAIEGTLTAQPCHDQQGCSMPTPYAFTANAGPGFSDTASESRSPAGGAAELPASGAPGGVSGADFVLPGEGLPGEETAASADRRSDASTEPVQVSARFSPPDESGRSILAVEADMGGDWHIYSITQPEGGPVRTEIALAPSSAYELAGDFESTTPPESRVEPLFDNLTIELHGDSVIWEAPIQWAEGVDPASVTIEGTVRAQPCHDQQGCMMPTSYAFTATLADVDPAGEYATREVVAVQSLWMAIAFAFLGGLILNITPCVLPVIGLKVMTFFEQAGRNRFQAFLLNVWYALGIISVFLILAAMAKGFGEVFQDDTFTVIVTCIVFAMALSLMGYWELTLPSFLSGSGANALMQKKGPAGAFIKGVLTTLLGASCGAPFLSPALAWVRDQPIFSVYIVFAVIGLGMASPFLLIGAFPELLRFLPKPGEWMETFKKSMGFLLLSAVVLLMFFMPPSLVLPTVALLFALWFACWVVGRLPMTATWGETLTAWSLAVLVIGGTLGLGFFGFVPDKLREKVVRQGMDIALDASRSHDAVAENDATAGEAGPAVDVASDRHANHWTFYTPEAFDQAIAEGKIVMLDFMTDSCLTCVALERAVLHSEEMIDYIEANDIVTMQANATKPESPDYAFLEKLGGGPVPVVAIFLPDQPKRPFVFRGWTSVDDLIEKMENRK